MDEDTNFDQAVDDVVHQAQDLDRWKQLILEDMRNRGEDTDGIRIIVSHKLGDQYTVTEVLNNRED